MKACTVCGIEKPLEDYSPDKRRRDGRQSQCKVCKNNKHKEWVSNNKEHVAEYMKGYYQRNKSKFAAQAARWAKQNPEKVRVYWNRRDARIREATIEKFSTRELFVRWGEFPSCYYCGEPYEHWDHVIPLAKGGEHSLMNLVPSCARCNLSKGSRYADEFIFDCLTRNEGER